MDILSLLDQLEQLIAGGKKTILSGDKVLVDPQEVFNLIDQMRRRFATRNGSNAKKIVSNPTPLPKTSASSARRRPKPCASSKKAVS